MLMVVFHSTPAPSSQTLIDDPLTRWYQDEQLYTAMVPEYLLVRGVSEKNWHMTRRWVRDLTIADRREINVVHCKHMQPFAPMQYYNDVTHLLFPVLYI